MSHFSKEVLSGDPDGLERLHRILHGCTAEERRTSEAEARLPTLEERFGHRPEPQRKVSRKRDAVLDDPRA